MQATRVIPVPDPSQKSNELFLYWLSLSETQYFLRNELSKVCPSVPRNAIESFHEPDSPSYSLTRSVSPPPNLSKSPRSSKGLTGISPKRRNSSKLLNQSLSDKPGLDHIDAGCSRVTERLEDVPRFYYPNGKKDTSENHQAMLRAATNIFQSKPGGHLSLEDFPALMQVCKLPVYWKAPLFNLCCGVNKTVDLAGFKKTWNKMVQGCHDTASRFVYMMTKGKRRYLLEEDFTDLIQDIIDSHPGLACLTAAPEFHSRYIETVIARIFYTVSKSWNFKITLSELRKSNFLEVLSELDKEEDINQELEYFSYEHFYVIYCKFWDLDTDHDCIIDADDLSRHSDNALLPTIVRQLMSGVVTRLQSTSGIMSYKDFVWFLLSEEDKTTSRSVEYWFRCMDMDGDGILSLYELQHFYEEMIDKMDALGIESLSIEDYMCQLLDMVHPREEGKITLRDLKDSHMATNFFNMCFNFEKYWEFEQDASCKNNGDDVEEGLSDWEKYAQEQYRALAAEEQANEDSDDELDEEDRKALL